MKAIRVQEFGDAEVMHLEDAPDLVPGNSQVVVKLEAAGVNPVDIYCVAGAFSWVSLPFTPGTDGAGIITRVGSDVRDRHVGQRVYTTFGHGGTYAEEVLCELDQVFPLPDSTTLEEGAGVFIPYATAYHGLFQRCNAQSGETVLVHGAAGAVGVAATQFAVAAGCRVIASAGNEHDLAFVVEQGATWAVNHYEPAHFEEVLDLSGGRGVDVIIEPVSSNVGQDVSILAAGGRIAVIGDRTPIEVDPLALTSRDGSILGTGVGNIPASAATAVHSAIFEGLEAGTLKPPISQRFPLAEAARAHKALWNPTTFGKIILKTR